MFSNFPHFHIYVCKYLSNCQKLEFGVKIFNCYSQTLEDQLSIKSLLAKKNLLNVSKRTVSSLWFHAVVPRADICTWILCCQSFISDIPSDSFHFHCSLQSQKKECHCLWLESSASSTSSALQCSWVISAKRAAEWTVQACVSQQWRGFCAVWRASLSAWLC